MSLSAYQKGQLITDTDDKRPRQVEAMVRLARRLTRLHDSKIPAGLSELLDKFGTFAKEYADILEDPNQGGAVPFLLHTGIERLLAEWSILCRACEQRSEVSTEPQGAGVVQQSVQHYLEEADKRLEDYCRAWRGAPPVSPSYLELKTPVVYFEKLYGISRALFAPEIPVVSIPLSDYDAPTEWQALAHEMGHHIFWNAIALEQFKGVQDDLRAAVANALCPTLGVSDPKNATKKGLQRLALWDSWLEEVFADVCGVLFAGPAFALSAQDLAAASVSKIDDFIGERDDEHPCLYLRPLVALQAVRQVAEVSKSTVYREKLLAWADRGVVETRRRAPAYEDELRVQKGARPQSAAAAQRLPAQLDAVRETLPPGGGWVGFTAAAATKKHPAAGVTLKELADDVPAVVGALLTQPTWPGKMRLLDLVDYHGRQATDEDIEELDLEALRWKKLPDITKPFPHIPDERPEPLSDFGRVLNRIRRSVKEADLEEAEEPRIFWSLLAAMNVVSDSAEYRVHGTGVAAHEHYIVVNGTPSNVKATWEHSHPSRTQIKPPDPF